jgi:hypothetical protein
MANPSPDATPPHPVILRGWRGRWYETVMWNPVIFHVFAWFNNSVPGTRGHLNRFMLPAEMRQR